MSYLSS